MPKPGYINRLTWEAVIRLFDEGRYYADFDEGIVYSGRTKKPLYTFTGNDGKHLWCRIFAVPGMRSCPVAQLIWVARTRTPIPEGWEVHHRNLDPTDNRWKNLFCLFRLDHDKLHKAESLDLTEEAF